jgi:prepilin-type N-terminal cleavage/methylation domain-containing protein
MNKNGFTLIELLVIIVILAVMAIILTPSTITFLDEAKKNAIKNSAYSCMESVEYYILTTSDNTTSNNNYELTADFIKDETDITGLNLKGEKPISLKLTIDNNQVISGIVTFNDYVVEIQNGEVVNVYDNIN